MIKKLLLGVFCLSLFALSCNDNPDEPMPDDSNFENAVLLDFGGLDGCSWIIQLEDKSNLEPINLADFPITPINELEIEVDYVTIINGATVCMVGTMVEIKDIRER